MKLLDGDIAWPACDMQATLMAAPRYHTNTTIPRGAYRLMWALRTLMPRRSLWRRCQFDTMRLRLIKLAVELWRNLGDAA
jgi:hypothetical protein